MRTDAATRSLLSPELALIDPELAAAARAGLPGGGEGEIWRLRFPTGPVQTARLRVPRGGRQTGPLRLLAGASVVCAVASAVAYYGPGNDEPYLVDDTMPPSGSPAPARISPQGGVAAASVAVRTTPAPSARPRAGRMLPVRVRPTQPARARRPLRSVVRLGWSVRAGATYYRVRIRRARSPRSAPMLEIWTVSPSVAIRLGAGARGDDFRTLAPGGYRWSVHASRRRQPGTAPVGRPIAGGEFTLSR